MLPPRCSGVPSPSLSLAGGLIPLFHPPPPPSFNCIRGRKKGEQEARMGGKKNRREEKGARGRVFEREVFLRKVYANAEYMYYTDYMYTRKCLRDENTPLCMVFTTTFYYQCDTDGQFLEAQAECFVLHSRVLWLRNPRGRARQLHPRSLRRREAKNRRSGGGRGRRRGGGQRREEQRGGGGGGRDARRLQPHGDRRRGSLEGQPGETSEHKFEHPEAIFQITCSIRYTGIHLRRLCQQQSPSVGHVRCVT